MDDKKKRLLVIVLFGVVAIAVILLMTESTVPAPPPVAKAPAAGAPNVLAPVATSTSASPTLPKGSTAAAQPMRDIFSPPAGYQAAATSTGSNGSRGGTGQAFAAAGSAPVLTGVIAGDERRVAILRQGAISRSYQVGESAGSYKVVSIGNRSVTLEGPNGTLNLTMGK